MVKTTGPLLSVNAHGQLAKTLNYSQRKEGNIGRQFHYPHKEPSQKQYTRRTILGLLTAHWQCMTDAQKLVWENNAKLTDLNISGFNYFVKSAMADLYTHHGLCGYWSFNELTGATAYDYSGNENHGTLKPTYPSDVPSRVDGQNKKFGKALSFDGINDYVDCGNIDILNFGTHNFTLESWVYSQEVTTAWHNYIDNGYLGATGRFRLAQSNAKKWEFLINNNILAGLEDILENRWYHVLGVRIVDNWYIYINGLLANSSTGAASWDVSPGDSLTFGQRSDQLGFFTFTGYIDEVRIYNRALSASEIMKHYELLRRPNRRQIRLV